MIHLFDLPHREARRLLATGAPVFLFVDPVEYHGPHLSLHNDQLVSRGLARDLHARLAVRHPDWPFLLGADLEVGVEPVPGPGSRHTPFPVVRAVVREACRAVAELGARSVVLMTFHGHPLHNLAIEAGVLLLDRAGVRAVAPFNDILREQLTLDTSGLEAAVAHLQADEAADVLRGLTSDFHGGFFETSMALYYAPASVSPTHTTLPPCPPIVAAAPLVALARLATTLGAVGLGRELTLASVGMGWNALRPFPGYTGRPHRATTAAGAVFANGILDRFERRVEAVLDGRERSPKPIMSWIQMLTLGGRLGNVPRPRMEQILAVP
jgi:creatinine amidohydrolase